MAPGDLLFLHFVKAQVTFFFFFPLAVLEMTILGTFFCLTVTHGTNYVHVFFKCKNWKYFRIDIALPIFRKNTCLIQGIFTFFFYYFIKEMENNEEDNVFIQFTGLCLYFLKNVKSTVASGWYDGSLFLPHIKILV